MFCRDQTFLVGCVFLCSTEEKSFSLCLADQLFQPVSNQVETVKKAFVWSCRVIVARVTTFPRGYHVSTEKVEKRWETSTVSAQTGRGWNGWSHRRTRRLTSYQLNSPGAVGVWFTIVLALTFKGLSVNSQFRSQTMTSLTQRHCLTIHCRNKVSYHDLKRHSICHASHVLSPVPLVLLITSHLIVLLVFTDLHLFIHSFVISFCFLWYILVLYSSREQIKMNRAVICVY